MDSELRALQKAYKRSGLAPIVSISETRLADLKDMYQSFKKITLTQQPCVKFQDYCLFCEEDSYLDSERDDNGVLVTVGWKILHKVDCVAIKFLKLLKDMISETENSEL